LDNLLFYPKLVYSAWSVLLDGPRGD